MYPTLASMTATNVSDSCMTTTNVNTYCMRAIHGIDCMLHESYVPINMIGPTIKNDKFLMSMPVILACKPIFRTSHCTCLRYVVYSCAVLLFNVFHSGTLVDNFCISVIKIAMIKVI